MKEKKTSKESGHLLMVRVRKALEGLPDVKEIKMFRGVALMVNDKMCVCVSGNELMCRIDPAIQETLLQKKGCRAMVMKGKVYPGYVYVEEEVLTNEQVLQEWIELALAYNPFAKKSKKKKKS